MRTKELEFDGKTYICRIVDSIDGEELLIGSTELLDALQPGSFEDVNEGFASKRKTYTTRYSTLQNRRIFFCRTRN